MLKFGVVEVPVQADKAAVAVDLLKVLYYCKEM
jgi:hypothetical protein